MTAPDLYTVAHKSLRLAVSDAALLLGTAEPATAHGVLAPMVAVLHELHAHAAHEDEFIGPLLGRHLPGLADEIARQHEALGATIDAVHRQGDRLAARAEVEPGAPLALYRAFQRLAAANLVHLDHEETVVMPALWTAVSPGALSDLMAAFNLAHPEAAQLFHRWPDALTPTERDRFGITSGATAAGRAVGAFR
jgi:hypothetical protein